MDIFLDVTWHCSTVVAHLVKRKFVSITAFYGLKWVFYPQSHFPHSFIFPTVSFPSLILPSKIGIPLFSDIFQHFRLPKNTANRVQNRPKSFPPSECQSSPTIHILKCSSNWPFHTFLEPDVLENIQTYIVRKSNIGVFLKNPQALTLSSAFYISTNLILDGIKDLNENPMIISVDSLETPMKDIEFPALTLCPDFEPDYI